MGRTRAGNAGDERQEMGVRIRRSSGRPVVLGGENTVPEGFETAAASRPNRSAAGGRRAGSGKRSGAGKKAGSGRGGGRSAKPAKPRLPGSSRKRPSTKAAASGRPSSGGSAAKKAKSAAKKSAGAEGGSKPAGRRKAAPSRTARRRGASKKPRADSTRPATQPSLGFDTATPEAAPAANGRSSSAGAVPPPQRGRKGTTTRRRVTAETLATKQREISVSEFFTKNRHLLGFDSPARALLTTVKEGVDNSLDAAEEAGILPALRIELVEVGDDRYRVIVEDNGPGIVKSQVPKVFGKLLYGSKFHRLRQSRGQQGIGISAAGMYGQLTTGKPVVITSKTGKGHAAHHFEIVIDTSRNKPVIVEDRTVEWEHDHGTRIEIELEGTYKGGRRSVDEYLDQ
ncbi:MAG: DNA topoisomerase VI subunit B, partial [Candidatus Krumholzibacteriia bacterium]